MTTLYIVKYSGPFGFIKPWTAVRDEETYSQQFLTPSIIAGIERKLFPELLKEDWGIYKIKGHRLTYKGISPQKEVTQTRGINSVKVADIGKIFTRGSYKNGKVTFAPLNRGVLIEPILYLTFTSKTDAETATTQHICLARNEDILYPDEEIRVVTEQAFNESEEEFNGFELVFEDADNSFMVGYNRMNNNEPMYGWLRTVGNPVKSYYE